MDSAKPLKELRDSLWQASIELGSPPGEELGDHYERPLDEVVERLREQGLLTETESTVVIDFLNRFDPDDGEPDTEVPDDLETQISRITAELRSVRAGGDRDLGGFGGR